MDKEHSEQKKGNGRDLTIDEIQDLLGIGDKSDLDSETNPVAEIFIKEAARKNYVKSGAKQSGLAEDPFLIREAVTLTRREIGVKAGDSKPQPSVPKPSLKQQDREALRKQFGRGKRSNHSLDSHSVLTELIEDSDDSEIIQKQGGGQKLKKVNTLVLGVITVGLFFIVALVSFYILYSNTQSDDVRISKNTLVPEKEERRETITLATDFLETTVTLSDFRELSKRCLPTSHLSSLIEDHWEPWDGQAAPDFRGTSSVPNTDYLLHRFHLMGKWGNRKAYLYEAPDGRFFFDLQTYLSIQDLALLEVEKYSLGKPVYLRARAREAYFYLGKYKEKEWVSLKLITENSKLSEDSVTAFARPTEAEKILGFSRLVNNESGTLDFVRDEELKSLPPSYCLIKAQKVGKYVEVLEIVSDDPSLYSFLNISLPLLRQK